MGDLDMDDLDFDLPSVGDGGADGEKMFRKRYEDDKDRAEEAAFAEEFMKRYGNHLEKMNWAQVLDYVSYVTPGKIIKGFFEFKCRYTPKEEYNTYYCSARKLQKAREWKGMANIPTALVVKWTNFTGIIKDLAEAKITHYSYDGRKDRGDPADIEPMFHVKHEDFTKLW